MIKAGKLSDVILKFLALWLIILVYGCGGGGSTIEETPSLIRLTSPSSFVEPDGKTEIPITVYVYSNKGNPMKGEKVSITSSPQIGSFDRVVKTTDNDGKVVFYYKLPNYTEIGDVDKITITANVIDTGISTTYSFSLEIPAQNLYVNIPVQYKILQADGKTKVPIDVYVFGADGKPMSGVSVQAFSDPVVGNFDKTSSITDEGGVALFNYTVPLRDELKKINTNFVKLQFKAYDKYGNIIVDNETLVFNDVSVGNGKPSAIILKANPSVILTSNLGNGPKWSNITAEVVDSAGNPIKEGYKILFKLQKFPSGTQILPQEVNLNNYYASAELFSGSSTGTVIVKAEVEGYPDVVSSSTMVSIISGAPSSITLLKSGKVQAQDDNGTRSINVFALVKDSNGNAVEDGTPVYFYLTDTCGGMIQHQSATVRGIAKATIVYPSQCIWKDFKLSAETSGGGLSGVLNDVYPAVEPVTIKLNGPNYVDVSGGPVYITGYIKDEGGDGLPIINVPVIFTSSLDNVTFSNSTVYSDLNGNFDVTAYIPPLPDNATEGRVIQITAQSGVSIGELTINQNP